MRLPAKLLTGLCAMSVLALIVGAGLNAGEKGRGMTIKVGDKAPTFTSVDDTGKTWKSSDHVGKKILVVYFYPADFTGGCTKQACGFRDNMGSLKSKDVEVVGVSGDAPKTHQWFKQHEKLNFTLLADEKGEVAKTFGVPVNKGGKNKGFNDKDEEVEVAQGVRISRWTVVIDKNGSVAAIYDVGKGAADDAKKVGEIVQKLETK
jgi:thioredoxin-dependent peroxiredoxin